MRELLLLGVALLVGCGADPKDTKEKLVLHDKIVCNANDVCAGEYVTCVRANYYSREWNCSVLMERK